MPAYLKIFGIKADKVLDIKLVHFFWEAEIMRGRRFDRIPITVEKHNYVKSRNAREQN